MKNWLFSFRLLLLFLLLPGWAAPAHVARGSGPYAVLLRNFAPIAGDVVSVQGPDVVIRPGYRQGVRAGDLFKVYRRGAPVGSGGTVSGYLKQPFALLQVIRSSGDSAVCKVLSGDGKIRKGMPVMRFSDMSAILEVSPDMKISQAARQRFEDTLPALEWLEPPSFSQHDDAAPDRDARQGAELVFRLSPRLLEVYGPDGRLLRTCGFSGEEGLVSARQVSDSGGPEKFRKEETDGVAAFRWSAGDMANALELEKQEVAGRLPCAASQVEVADLDGNGMEEVVYLVSRSLYVVPFGDSGRPVSWVLNGPGRITGFSAAGYDGLIAVNVLVDGVGLRSALLRYRGGELSTVLDSVNLWLSFQDLSGRCAAGTLIGQVFDLRTVWGGRVYVMSVAASGMVYRYELEVPDDFRLGWSKWADLDGNKDAELCVVDRSGRAWIYEDGILRWSFQGAVLVAGHGREMRLPSLAVCMHGRKRPSLLLAGSMREKGELTGDMVYEVEYQGGDYAIRPFIRPVDARIAGISRVADGLMVAVARGGGPDGGDNPQETVLYRISLPREISGTGP